MFKSSSICARGLSLGSTDSTHNVTTYNYGLESERNFNITIVNKTFSYANDGTRTENSVTLNNLWNFSVDDLDVTFTMPYSGSCTYTASEGTVTNSDTGTGCEVIVTLDLNAYQTKTISVSPIITSTEETTPSGGTTTYSPSSEQLEEGYSKLLRKTQKVQFIINEETYTAVINSVNVINKKVEIEIEGEGILVELSEGSVGKIDLNDDGYYDLQISCKEVRINGYADLEFKEIHEEIPAEEKEEQESPSKVEEIKIKNWMWISGGTILLIVVGIVIRRLLKKSNKL